MSRPPRIHYPGAVYHVMARGVDGRDVFIDESDRRIFLTTILRLKSETAFSILAYCLMGNHFHFAIKIGKTPLSRIMHRLLTTYVLGFNSRHTREGHLFQARYKSILCLDDAYLIGLIRYIHMNPVRAGLVTNCGDWPWSSHRQYTEKTSTPLADTKLFFDAAAAWEPATQEFERWENDANGSFEPWPKIETSSRLLREDSPDVSTLDAIALELFPDDLEELKSGSRRRDISQKKAIVVKKAVQNGHSQIAIAAWMSCAPSAIHRLLRRNK